MSHLNDYIKASNTLIASRLRIAKLQKELETADKCRKILSEITQTMKAIREAAEQRKILADKLNLQ